MRRWTRNFIILSPGKSARIWTFEDRVFQTHARSGQNSVQPNRRICLSDAVLYIHVNTSRDPFYNFNIEN